MSGAVGAGRLVWVRQGFERVSEKAPGGRENYAYVGGGGGGKIDTRKLNRMADVYPLIVLILIFLEQ